MKSKRHIYLNMKTLAEAKAVIQDLYSQCKPLGMEVAAVPEAVSRVLAEPVFARLSSPAFHAAAMDGIAVKAEDTYSASEAKPKSLILGESAFMVNTGRVLPAHTNAVIMIEQVNISDDRQVIIEAPAFPWQHVRKVGEDIVATELMFPTNHVITPYCVGALLAGGVFQVQVRRKPQVLIIPTGSELIDFAAVDVTSMAPGKVIESNSYILGKLVAQCGGEFQRHPIIADAAEKIREAVRQAVAGEYDMILTVGGSSAGSEDFTRNMVQDLGEVLIHGVTMMPGKPLIIGSIAHKPIFGIPGYPVSAIIAFEQFVAPLIRQLLGVPCADRPTLKVITTRKIPSKLGVEEFVRVKIGMVGDNIVATPLPRAAGSITSITDADGIIRIPNHVEGLQSGQEVEAELLRPLSALKDTIVAVGSHDNTLDTITDLLRKTPGGYFLSSSHVGSMGGLMAIKRGLCHIAGVHLLDATDGSYNVSYIRKHLQGVEVRLVHLVEREQGFILAQGNPEKIRGIEDLTRADIHFINRQAGSGTRILLDYRLAQLGIDPAGVAGYEQEEFTHMAVAAAVLSGAADVGLGIFAAARALNLDFLPVVTEYYELVIPVRHLETRPMQKLLAVIRSAEFKDRVNRLGGYGTGRTGEIVL